MAEGHSIIRWARLLAPLVGAPLEQVRLPEDFWDRDWTGLSNEAREKLQRWRPATVGMASRITGVSPSDVAVLLVHARRLRGERSSAGGSVATE